ncbi:histidine phosphatase family protein [Hymenobacter sp. BRD67]|uniref:histidine phosphatase family protein n=1 Tax=Hymenobacter sp. BRD67 TaxID=2675877 RepID=UPI001567317E|nr:histidine phosphatase family protein [Hymenobacter sp. BRD67]QKG52604.1 histidine phosphatase family protein [Hymenobacter sp. BRD67]
MKTGLRQLLFSVVMVLATCASVVARPPVTTIYLVRHAEKDLTPGLADPPLTAAGEARAQLLARRLKGRHPAALFTTDTRRTRATLAPLALTTGLTPLVYNAKEPAALVARLGQQYAGKTVVVVGHSNTLLPLLAALGVVAPVAEIKEDEFDYLFKVELRPGQAAKLAVSRYGAGPHAAGASSGGR